MGATQKYTIIAPETGKIDRRIFIDQAIYDEEMAKIFGRAWLMIGHESLVPSGQRLFHTYMGEDPVILTRDSQGRLHALLNMPGTVAACVVRCDDGNARHFMCTYHGWTYANDGTLEYVPGESRPITTRWTDHRWASSRPASTPMPGSSLPPGQRMPEPRGLPRRRAGIWIRSLTGGTVACRPSAQ